MPELRATYLHSNAKMPLRAHENDSGLDLSACLDSVVVIEPGERALIPTGLAFGIPFGYEAQVRPRSGLAAKKGVFAILGTVDQPYVGEVKVILLNASTERFIVHDGDRIAQLVIAPVAHVNCFRVDEL